MKLNKNGIPILDPPGNKMPKKKLCLPDQHKWEEDLPLHPRYDYNRNYFKCLYCDDCMSEAVDEE